jgi:hypothetical protein
MATNFNGRVKKGTYTCDECGKLTRETDQDAASCGLCADCYDRNGEENYKNDHPELFKDK